ncbi:stage II sporulation protein D [Virgibacillus alimentarius]|uniref:Stage II sporulation protein D n=1 Tax=Virgibacillus alimentarius TaxID=698769 RepID=A0ABS4S7B8_9BACI|nr:MULTISPECIES: stage II sporulation protein D [Virgibacillus]MBP2257383.1 stage II sporulation protein D [Virgibacillus alimentarius]HLR67733.1 stage II sporulation protein D [Virgibacillus sp.]
MKNRKYTYKTAMPKAWRKKKRKKRHAIDALRHKKNTTKQFNRPIPSLYWKQKKWKQFKKPISAWKLLSILALSSLMMIILVIPSLVVVPFGDDHTNESSAKPANEANKKQPEAESDSAAEIAKDSAFTVAVKRADTEKVEDVSLEDYVAGVVASEMPAEFELEALKAQSLAARTFIVNHLLHQGTPDAEVTDTVQHQVYKSEADLQKQWGKDYNQKMDKVKKAVAATKGEILTYDNSPITPAFFSTSNGYTENSEDYWDNELPYLRSVKSGWDKNSPKFLEQQIFPINEVEEALNIQLPKNTKVPTELNRTESNRVEELKLADQTFSGRDVREKLNLRSSDFSIEQKNNHLIFTTKGFGHGVGMSQYGANGMAKEGKKYDDIVKYYYQDIEINKITETAPTLVAK